MKLTKGLLLSIANIIFGWVFWLYTIFTICACGIDVIKFGSSMEGYSVSQMLTNLANFPVTSSVVMLVVTTFWYFYNSMDDWYAFISLHKINKLLSRMDTYKNKDNVFLSDAKPKKWFLALCLKLFIILLYVIFTPLVILSVALFFTNNYIFTLVTVLLVIIVKNAQYKLGLLWASWAEKVDNWMSILQSELFGVNPVDVIRDIKKKNVIIASDGTIVEVLEK